MNRKIILSTILLAFVFTFNLKAQKLQFGIHGLPVLNYVTTDDADVETGSKLKFGFGLIAQYNFTDRYSFSTGLDILNRGGDITLRDTTGSYSAGFLNIPLVLKMRSKEVGYITYFADFGGGLSFKTSEDVSFSPDFDKNKVSELDYYISPLNVTFTIGGGIEYNLGGSTSLIAEVTYNRSLVDNFASDNIYLTTDAKYKLDYVALKVGIIF